jgi:hypothetical protein
MILLANALLHVRVEAGVFIPEIRSQTLFYFGVNNKDNGR